MIVDFSTLQIANTYTGSVTFLDETAGFKNAFGMYKIADDGSIYDVTIIFANSSAEGSGGDLTPGETTFDVTFTADEKVGFFVLPNAYNYDTNSLLTDGGTSYVMRNDQGAIANVDDGGPIHLMYVGEDGREVEIKALYDNRTWHSTAEASNNFALNGDGTDHTIWDLQVDDGTLVLDMRFEDLWNGGDMDYRDIVFRLDVGPDNTLETVDSGKDPATALASSDRVVVPQGETVIFDPLANDKADGLIITHLNGQKVKEGDTITLDDGEMVTLLEGGKIRIESFKENSDRDFNKVITYSVIDENGATDSSVIAIVTPAFAKDDVAIVTARGQSSINVLENDEIADGGSLAVTHISGREAVVGESYDLASGTRAVYRGDGVFGLYGADVTEDVVEGLSYTVVDENGVSSSARAAITTSPVDGTEGNDTFTRSGEGDKQGNYVGGADGESEVIMGYGGNDKIFAGAGDDALYGGEGNDNLRGEEGNDLLVGGNGHDLLSGGQGINIMYGGQGNDAYWVENIKDQLFEERNEGTDKVTSSVDWTLGDNFENLYLEDTYNVGTAKSGTGNDLNNFIGGNELDNILSGMGGDDRIVGMEGDDFIFGGDGKDTLNGGVGTDTISGGAGKDKIFGDEGNDRIIGGVDTDYLTGGEGSDTFVFALGDGTDILYDFVSGEDFIEMQGMTLEHLTLRKYGSGTKVEYGDGDWVYAAKLDGEMLNEADFIFA